MLKLRTTLTLGATAVALVAAGVLPAAAQDGEGLTVGVSAPPRTMNPHGSDADSNLSVMANMFEGLLQRDVDGNLKPALATDWERRDELTWRFHLRQGVKFHNGNDFTWEDVKFTIARLRNPEVSEFLNFGSLVESVETVDGDPWTIDITTKHPVPFLVQNLHQVFIMDQESTEARSTGEVGQNPIGTGPYEFVEWVKGSYLRMRAFEGYWDEQPEVKQAELQPLTEASTAMAAISSGSVDILQDVPVASVKAIEQNPGVELVTRPARRSIFLSIANEADKPTSDVRVRRAIYHAINEQEIIDKVMFGHAAPAAQIPDPPTTGHSDEIERLAYDPDKAEQLLAEAGYADGFEITLDGPNDRYVQDEQILATVASHLAKVGIDVTVNAKPKSIFFDEVANQKLDFYLIGWFDGAYDFGRSYSKLLHTVDKEAGYGGFNGTRYSNPLLDKVFALSNQIVDPALREDALQLLNKLAMDQVAVIPLHYQQDIYAVYKGRGVDFRPRSDTWIVFKQIRRGS